MTYAFFRLLAYFVSLETNVVLVPITGASADFNLTGMAEAVAIIGLVSSIASLIELGAKIVFSVVRIHF